jgi:hypothetical protein
MHIIHPIPGGFIRSFRIVFGGPVDSSLFAPRPAGVGDNHRPDHRPIEVYGAGASVVAVDSVTGATLKAKLSGEGTYVLTKLPRTITSSRSQCWAFGATYRKI